MSSKQLKIILMLNLYNWLEEARTCTYKVYQCMKTLTGLAKPAEEFLWEKWPPAFSTKWLKPFVFGYKNRSIYTHLLNQYTKFAKAKGIGHLSQTGFSLRQKKKRRRKVGEPKKYFLPPPHRNGQFYFCKNPA